MVLKIIAWHRIAHCPFPIHIAHIKYKCIHYNWVRDAVACKFVVFGSCVCVAINAAHNMMTYAYALNTFPIMGFSFDFKIFNKNIPFGHLVCILASCYYTPYDIILVRLTVSVWSVSDKLNTQWNRPHRYNERVLYRQLIIQLVFIQTAQI